MIWTALCYSVLEQAWLPTTFPRSPIVEFDSLLFWYFCCLPDIDLGLGPDPAPCLCFWPWLCFVWIRTHTTLLSFLMKGPWWWLLWRFWCQINKHHFWLQECFSLLPSPEEFNRRRKRSPLNNSPKLFSLLPSPGEFTTALPGKWHRTWKQNPVPVFCRAGWHSLSFNPLCLRAYSFGVHQQVVLGWHENASEDRCMWLHDIGRKLHWENEFIQFTEKHDNEGAVGALRRYFIFFMFGIKVCCIWTQNLGHTKKVGWHEKKVIECWSLQLQRSIKKKVNQSKRIHVM